MISRNLQQRLSMIESRQQQASAWNNADTWWQFLVTPTCPPSKQVQIRPGYAQAGPRWGNITYQTYTEATICDFGDTTLTGFAATFTNTRWYRGVLMCYYGEWMAYRVTESEPRAFTIIHDDVEYESNTEAEAAIDYLLNGGDDWMYYLFPLWAIVLRNNGDVGTDGAVDAIDRVNRSRSYLYRDIRARNYLAT